MKFLNTPTPFFFFFFTSTALMAGYQKTLQPSIKSMRNEDKMIMLTTQTGLPTERERQLHGERETERDSA